MAKVFILKGSREGKSIRLMNRYTFIDGVMVEEDDDTAKLKAAVLVPFYGVKMMDYDEYVRRNSKSGQVAQAEPNKSSPQPQGAQTKAQGAS